MEPQSSSQQPSHPRPAVRSPLDARSGKMASETHPDALDGLKHAALSFKDSSLSYIQAKAELTSIEAKEAAGFAKQKLILGLGAALMGFFVYALFLFLLYGIIMQAGATALENMSSVIGLNSSNITLLLMLILHVIPLTIFIVKLGKKPEEELFALTKSELKKDKQWLAEINQNEN